MEMGLGSSQNYEACKHWEAKMGQNQVAETQGMLIKF